MATFEVTGPDGKKYRVDGANAAGAARAVARMVRPESNGPELVARTDDGEIFRMANGQLAFKSPGFATTDQDQIARLMEGATPAGEVQKSFDDQRISEHPIASRALEFVQGTPLVGEFVDEAVGLVSPRAAENMRATSDAMERQHPGQSLALNVGGGIVGSLPGAAVVGGKVADYVSRGGNALMRALRAGSVAAPAGALEGGLSFAGRADDGDRLAAAETGTKVGGVLGAALGPAASLVGEGAGAFVKYVKKLDIRTIADEFGISPAAARTVKRALLNDDLDAAIARLGQIGDDAMLADSGPATRQLLDASSKTGGRALRVTREAVGRRAGEMRSRLSGRLDDILGKPKGIKAAAREIAQETAGPRRAAYDRAFARPIDYSGSGRGIEDVLARVPPKTMMRAVREANEAMIEGGRRNMQIMAQIGDDGSVVFREMPNLEQIDQIKRALGEIGKAGVDQFGRPTAQGLRARRLARDLRGAAVDAVPEYGTALRLGGDKLQRDEALDIGRKLLFRRTTVEDVRDIVHGGMSREAREAARQGIRETIEDTMSNVRRAISDPDTDAREAMQVVREISSRANRDKLRLILGDSQAEALIGEIDRQAAALALRDVVARNSDTAIRQSIQQQVGGEVTPGPVRRILGNMGNPLDGAREISRTLAGIDTRSMGGAERAIFAEIADILTSVRGQDAQKALAVVDRAMRGQPVKDAEARLIGRAVAGSVAVGGYQPAQQSLKRTPQ